MKLNALSLAALLVFTAPHAAHAQYTAVPQRISFQGRLATTSGNPVPDGTYSVRFSLWNVASAGTAAANEKWNQTISPVTVKNGVFAVSLNVSTGAADKFKETLWLEIKVGTDTALTPRTPLSTVPYAFKADKVTDGAITTASIANGAVTDAKIVSVDWSKITSIPTDSLRLPFAANQTLAAPDALFYINNTGSGEAIHGESVDGTAIYGKSSNIGVFGESTNAAAVYGHSVNVSGVFGISDNYYGVYGYAQNNHGVYGKTFAANGGGVVGENDGGSYGVLAGPSYGVYGSSAGGTGGKFTTTGTNGVFAESTATGGNGIYAVCNNGTSAYGVLGASSTGYGVVGSGSRYGIYSSGPAGGSTGWANLSDIRYKQNVATVDNALEAILNLRGVTYEYRRDEFKGMNFPKGTQIGFIAQEVEKVLPQLVTTDANGYKSVTYSNAVPVLVEAVKTQNRQMEKLSRENAELKARLERIEAALAELKAQK